MSRFRGCSSRPDARPLGLGVAVLAGCWVAVRHGFYAHDLIGDTALYAAKASLVRHGGFPYRDVPFEYPPGALPVLVAPIYLGAYATAFGWLMAACAACTLVLVGLHRVEAAAFMAVSPLLVGALVLNRFDFWPA